MISTEFVSHEAALEYLEDSRLSLWMGLIGPNEHLGRLISLKALVEPNSAIAGYCSRVLTMEDCNESDDWPSRSQAEAEQSRGQDEEGSKVRIQTGEDDFGDTHIVQFIAASNTGLSAWEFHKGDADPIPSVPHGHYRTNSKKKLDPYNGYIFTLGKQTNRAKRDSIIALWNDRSFRQFAREAIEHFIDSRQGWRWRVQNPRRLPRIRR